MLRVKLVGKRALYSVSFQQIEATFVERKRQRNSRGIDNFDYLILPRAGAVSLN